MPRWMIVAALVSALAPAAPTAAEEVDGTATLRFTGSEPPQQLAWVRAGEDGADLMPVPSSDPSVALPPGEGCLALVRSGKAASLRELALGPGAVVDVEQPEWAAGEAVRGVVASDTLQPIRGRVVLQRVPAVEHETSPECAAALRALGVTATRPTVEGMFTLGPLAKGVYRLSVEADAHEPASLTVSVDGSQAEKTLDPIRLTTLTRLTVSVDRSDMSDEPPFTLTLERENDRHLSDRDRWQSEGEQEITSDDPITITSRPGTYRLTLHKKGSSFAFAETEVLVPGDQRLVLTPRPVYLDGRVTRDGEPVEDASVELHHASLIYEATTSPYGAYTMAVWVRGNYFLHVTTPDGAVVLDHVDLSEAEPGETRELDVEIPTASVSGLVLAAADKRPLEGASVTLRQTLADQGLSTNRSATSEADGRFVFEGVSPDARIELVAELEGYARGETTTEASEGADAFVVLELDALDTVHGTVVDEEGRPLAGVAVACCPDMLTGMLLKTATADQQGRFALDVAPGATLFASVPAHPIGWGRVVDDEVTVVVRHRIPPTRIKVVTTDGSPVPGVSLTYAALDGTVVPSHLLFQAARLSGTAWRTDADGTILVTALPSGTYTVLLRSRNGLVPIGTAPLPSSGEVVVAVPD